MRIEKLNENNKTFIEEYLKEHWHASFIVSRGIAHWINDLDGFAAFDGNQLAGFITYYIKDLQMEIVTLNSIPSGKGIGSTLLFNALEYAKEVNLKRVWLITTNDNMDSLRFFQKKGFDLIRIHNNAMDITREMKPQIPVMGRDGILLKHELELEYLV
jgi:ribosomal protein S18 acetylase RimI-like enzyme